MMAFSSWADIVKSDLEFSQALVTQYRRLSEECESKRGFSSAETNAADDAKESLLNEEMTLASHLVDAAFLPEQEEKKKEEKKAEAITILKRLAEQEHYPLAQYALALTYIDGQVTPQNTLLGIEWLCLVAGYGYPHDDDSEAGQCASRATSHLALFDLLHEAKKQDWLPADLDKILDLMFTRAVRVAVHPDHSDSGILFQRDLLFLLTRYPAFVLPLMSESETTLKKLLAVFKEGDARAKFMQAVGDAVVLPVITKRMMLEIPAVAFIPNDLVKIMIDYLQPTVGELHSEFKRFFGHYGSIHLPLKTFKKRKLLELERTSVDRVIAALDSITMQRFLQSNPTCALVELQEILEREVDVLRVRGSSSSSSSLTMFGNNKMDLIAIFERALNMFPRVVSSQPKEIVATPQVKR